MACFLHTAMKIKILV